MAIIKKGAYQDGNPSRLNTNTQDNCNTKEKIKKVGLISKEDYNDLISFAKGVKRLLVNDEVDLAIESLDFFIKIMNKKKMEVE